MRPELIEQQLVHHGIDVGLVLDGEVGQTQQCRDVEEWLPLTDRWWHVLEAAGWTLRPLGTCTVAKESAGDP